MFYFLINKHLVGRAVLVPMCYSRGIAMSTGPEVLRGNLGVETQAVIVDRCQVGNLCLST